MDPTFAAGLAYVLLSAPLIALQLLTLIVFASCDEYRQLTCYRIMFSIGVADTAQLVVHAASGVAMLCDYLFLGWTADLLGAVLFAAWMAMVPQHAVLAANQLLIVTEGAGIISPAGERRLADVRDHWVIESL